MAEYFLEARNVVKQFPGTLALDNVSCSFKSGAVHAVIGKNGSGKSTLMKIFSGVHDSTKGEIYLYNKKIEHNNPTQALKNGIATVYQELSLVKDLMVGENIFLGRLPMKNKYSIDWSAVYKLSAEVLEQLGVNINPKTYVKDLPVGQQQLVEIAKAMSFKPKVLILDEPTSALSDTECQHLFEVVRGLKDKGIIILFITHRLQELYSISDYVTVLRDGLLIGTKSIKELEPKDIIQMMFGEVEHKTKPSCSASQEVVLEVKNLKNNKLKNVSFSLKKGEILGIAGMMGAGRTETLRAIFGLDTLDFGEISVNGEIVKKPNPYIMKKLGVGYTSENRKEEGLCLNLSIGDNLCMASLYDISPKGRIDRKMEKEYIEKQILELQIKVPDEKAPALSMSGGNQQKIVVGNWLNTKPQILFMDEPSRGIDVNAKQQIFNIMWEEAKKGVSIIMVSSELEELLEVCDRILIMRGGEIKAELPAKDMTVEMIYSQSMEEDN